MPFIWATLYREDRCWGMRQQGKLVSQVEANAEAVRL
jgi:hypothetical protein